jgi:hypothetical protein
VEARRAIVAWQDGTDARELLPDDAPTLAAVIDAYGQRPDGAAIDRYQRGPIVTTEVNGRPFGDWRISDVTREMIETFRRQRPKIAGNRGHGAAAGRVQLGHHQRLRETGDEEHAGGV